MGQQLLLKKFQIESDQVMIGLIISKALPAFKRDISSFAVLNFFSSGAGYVSGGEVSQEKKRERKRFLGGW
jgi:hypothetical protein